jgi:hypothetical protein
MQTSNFMYSVLRVLANDLLIVVLSKFSSLFAKSTYVEALLVNLTMRMKQVAKKSPTGFCVEILQEVCCSFKFLWTGYVFLSAIPNS